MATGLRGLINLYRDLPECESWSNGGFRISGDLPAVSIVVPFFGAAL